MESQCEEGIRARQQPGKVSEHKEAKGRGTSMEGKTIVVNQTLSKVSAGGGGLPGTESDRA